MADILIIDDEEPICRLLGERLNRLGHNPSWTFTLGEGLERAREGDFDVIFLDVRLPDGNGLEAIPLLREIRGAPEVVIMTGLGDPDGAELAIKSGAWDYLQKGVSLKNIPLLLNRVLRYRQEKASSKTPVALKKPNIVGNHANMNTCFDLLAKAAASEINVLIHGETGTGKELFARAIHENSNRREGPFVILDCAALPETLVESILFGHGRGAFTGADRSQVGLIRQADRGTLFLDEVGELPSSTQKAFLRVLQERCFRPVGESKEITSDFRLVAATNRDLDQMVDKGRFRKDLLYRLRAMDIEVPPLRQRVEDIRDIAVLHIARLCERYGIKTKGFDQSFLDALRAHSWPGNVRELINALEHAIITSQDHPTLFERHLPEDIRIALVRASLVDTSAPSMPISEEVLSTSQDLPRLNDLLHEETNKLEKWYLTELMARTNGDFQEAQNISGLGRTVLYDRLKKHGLTRR